MDEDAASPSSNMIPIALAVLGIVLGTAGLYFGFTANKNLNSIDASVQEGTTSAAQTEKSIDLFDVRIAALEEQISEQSKIINRLRVYSSQSEQAVKKLAAELNVNREQIVKTAKQLNEVRASGIRIESSAETSNSNAQSAEVSNNVDAASTASGKERTYVIASGDNFSKIATQFGVSVQAIIDANPYADPRRLAIGQKIVIPAK